MAGSVKAVLILIVVAGVLLSNLAESANVDHHHKQRLVRSSSPTKEPAEVNHCSHTTPCGWAVYTRFTRMVDYFMKNTCTCEPGLECVRVDDDVSVSAYVYKCRHVPKTSSNKHGDGGDAS